MEILHCFFSYAYFCQKLTPHPFHKRTKTAEKTMDGPTK